MPGGRRRCPLKHLLEKDFAQPPKSDLANELNCRPTAFQEEPQPAFIPIALEKPVASGD